MEIDLSEQNKQLEVLVATMGQTDFANVHEMNIQSDVFYANQADRVEFAESNINGNHCRMLTTHTRGVGINRNLGLLYARGDYLLFADDDLRYVDGYDKIIKKAFQEVPDADGILFNVEGSLKSGEARRKNADISQIRWFNCLNYGAVRLAVKRTSI